MKIQSKAVRLFIIFTISVAVAVLMIVFYHAIKIKFKEYPEELLLKTSEEIRAINTMSERSKVVLTKL